MPSLPLLAFGVIPWILLYLLLLHLERERLRDLRNSDEPSTPYNPKKNLGVTVDSNIKWLTPGGLKRYYEARSVNRFVMEDLAINKWYSPRCFQTPAPKRGFRRMPCYRVPFWPLAGPYLARREARKASLDSLRRRLF